MQWTFCKKSFEDSVAELEPFFGKSYQDSVSDIRHLIVITTGHKRYQSWTLPIQAPALEFSFRVFMHPRTNVVIGRLMTHSKIRLNVRLTGVVLTDCYEIKRLLIFTEKVWQEKSTAIIHELEDRYLLT